MRCFRDSVRALDDFSKTSQAREDKNMATTRIPSAEIDRILEDSVSGADAQRATRLDQLAQIRSAKAVQFERERERFAAVAEKNDPFFAALDAREQANQGL